MGLALLGAILEREGYEVSIFDINSFPWGHKVVMELMYKMAGEVDVIGLTAMTPTISNVFKIATEIRRRYPQLRIMLGGVHATLLPLKTLNECSALDVVAVGEGEKLVINIMDTSVHHGVFGRNHQTIDMDDLPYLAYHLLPWLDYKPHPPHGRALPWLPMITSRGCPYQCSYCSKVVFGSKFRAQSPARVVDEMVYLQERFGVKEIAFYDDVFTLDSKRVYGIAEEILSRGLKVCWTCETRADLVDAELLAQMRKAGCYSISYGIESGSQDILDVIGKGITLEQSEEAVRLTQEAGMQTIGYFMIGSPNETPETVRQTIEFAKNLKLDYAQFAIATPFPYTKLWDYYKDEHEEMNIPWESLVYAGTGSKVSPVFESEALSRGDIERWVSRAYREFYLRPSYIWQRLSGIRSLGDAQVLAKGIGMLRGM